MFLARLRLQLRRFSIRLLSDRQVCRRDCKFRDTASSCLIEWRRTAQTCSSDLCLVECVSSTVCLRLSFKASLCQCSSQVWPRPCAKLPRATEIGQMFSLQANVSRTYVHFSNILPRIVIVSRCWGWMISVWRKETCRGSSVLRGRFLGPGCRWAPSGPPRRVVPWVSYSGRVPTTSAQGGRKASPQLVCSLEGSCKKTYKKQNPVGHIVV